MYLTVFRFNLNCLILSSGQRQFTFNLAPSVSGELHLPSCELIVGLKLLYDDGSPIEATTQVGIVQSFGALIWQNSVVRINGKLCRPFAISPVL